VIRDEAARLRDGLTEVQSDATRLFGPDRTTITPERAVRARALSDRQMALTTDAFTRMLSRLSAAGADRLRAFVEREKRRMTLVDAAEAR
jgi:hypothetical protein